MERATIMPIVTLKPGRERSLQRRHPWIFSNAIAHVKDDPRVGETVDVLGADGQWLGRGAFSPNSQIMVRMWMFDKDTIVGPEFFRGRIERAVQARRLLGMLPAQTACRLVNAESDGLPGLVVDRYADFTICQLTAAGVEFHRDAIVAALAAVVPGAGIYERSDVSVREKEGLALRTGLLHGSEPPDRIEIREGGCRFLVDVRQGHKTGWYLDQAENRAIVAQYCAGRSVLNCFSYAGGFSIAALSSGARQVTNVDSSAAALDLARHNMLLNGLDADRAENIPGNAFQVLRGFRDGRREFEVIILDPPKFVESEKQLQRGGAAYKDINLLALKLLAPGGVLATFSCSGRVDAGLFQNIVSQAAADAGREVQIIRPLSQAADHPLALNFPEGAYLKGLVCRVW
jgi:23S rRNA (cytosine1962-C5)-methyltransferase